MANTNQKIFEYLKKVALDDGVMSPEETMIISYAMKNANAFDFALKKAKSDGVIDEEEKKELDNLRRNIFEGAAEIAEKDDIIDLDEIKLLTKLLEIIEELKKEYDLEEMSEEESE